MTVHAALWCFALTTLKMRAVYQNGQQVDFTNQWGKNINENGVIQILATIFCPFVTCSNVPAIQFYSSLINFQYNFQNLNDKHLSQMVLSTCNMSTCISNDWIILMKKFVFFLTMSRLHDVTDMVTIMWMASNLKVMIVKLHSANEIIKWMWIITIKWVVWGKQGWMDSFISALILKLQCFAPSNVDWIYEWMATFSTFDAMSRWLHFWGRVYNISFWECKHVWMWKTEIIRRTWPSLVIQSCLQSDTKLLQLAALLNWQLHNIETRIDVVRLPAQSLIPRITTVPRVDFNMISSPCITCTRQLPTGACQYPWGGFLNWNVHTLTSESTTWSMFRYSKSMIHFSECMHKVIQVEQTVWWTEGVTDWRRVIHDSLRWGTMNVIPYLRPQIVFNASHPFNVVSPHWMDVMLSGYTRGVQA